jgi:hypothetical protein
VERVSARWYRRQQQQASGPSSIWEEGTTYVFDPSLFARPEAVDTFTEVEWEAGIIDDVDELVRRRGEDTNVQRFLSGVETLLTTPSLQRLLALSRDDVQPFAIPLRTRTEMQTIVEHQNVDISSSVLPYERSEKERQLLDQLAEIRHYLDTSQNEAHSVLRDQWTAQHVGLPAIDDWLYDLLEQVESQPTAVVREPGAADLRTDPASDETLWPKPAATREWVRALLKSLDNIDHDRKAERLQVFLNETEEPVCCCTQSSHLPSYLEIVVEKTGRPVFRLRSGARLATMQETIQRFHEQGGIMIVPDATLGHLDLINASAVVHYDLPMRSGEMQRRQAAVLPHGAAPVSSYAFHDQTDHLPGEETLLHRYDFL